MSLFEDNIDLKEFLLLFVCLFLVQFALNYLNIVHINNAYLYIVIILYFIIKFRNNTHLIKNDFYRLFSFKLMGNILFIVILNIFLSYGFLYLSNLFLPLFNNLNVFYVNLFSSTTLKSSLIFETLIPIILISPICEELVFRGLLLNKFRLIFSINFTILISSLLFASLHSYGSITAAFIFGVCMAILYLKTNNLLVPIFAHILNNLLSETIFILDTNSILFTNQSVILLISSLAIISVIFILIFIFKELNNFK